MSRPATQLKVIRPGRPASLRATDSAGSENPTQRIADSITTASVA
jgi:hypothetical protein